jgi:hypothetical protein
MTWRPEAANATLADYKAVEERLREVRSEAAAGIKAAQASGDAVAGADWISKLQREFDAFKCFREGLPEGVRLSVNADRILESFFIDERGFVNLTIPPDISDEGAIRALNERFKELFPDKKRGAIHEPDIEKILGADDGSGRSPGDPRKVRLLGVVPGTTGMTRDEQRRYLKNWDLVFPHPAEQALAAIAYACKCDAEDLFKGIFARSAIAPHSLGTDRSVGLWDSWHSDVLDNDNLAASGVPAVPLK